MPTFQVLRPIWHKTRDQNELGYPLYNPELVVARGIPIAAPTASDALAIARERGHIAPIVAQVYPAHLPSTAAASCSLSKH